MNSESLYRYSKARQHLPGFTVLKGCPPNFVFEHNNSFLPADTFGLFCTIQSIGRYDCNKTLQLYRDPISSFDLLYVYSGSPEIQCGEKKLTLSTHEVFISNGSKPYELWNHENEAVDFLLLSHFGAISEKYCDLITKSGVRKLSLRSRSTFEDLLRNLEFYMKYRL